jgi:hypothetical protein
VAGCLAFAAIVCWLVSGYFVISIIWQNATVLMWLAASVALTAGAVRVVTSSWAETRSALRHPIRSAKTSWGAGGGLGT